MLVGSGVAVGVKLAVAVGVAVDIAVGVSVDVEVETEIAVGSGASVTDGSMVWLAVRRGRLETEPPGTVHAANTQALITKISALPQCRFEQLTLDLTSELKYTRMLSLLTPALMPRAKSLDVAGTGWGRPVATSSLVCTARKVSSSCLLLHNPCR